MLIKLTSLPHPDLNEGKPYPVYIDASRILLVIRGHQQYPKIGSIERRQELHRAIFAGAEKLVNMVNNYMPSMTDPVAVEWMRQAAADANAVSSLSNEIRSFSITQDYHPRVECTEVQLACGTALEHGVMLTRVWVTETPEEVVAILSRTGIQYT